MQGGSINETCCCNPLEGWSPQQPCPAEAAATQWIAGSQGRGTIPDDQSANLSCETLQGGGTLDPRLPAWSPLPREIRGEELRRFCSRVSQLLQKDLGPDTADALQRLFLIVSATKYNRK